MAVGFVENLIPESRQSESSFPLQLSKDPDENSILRSFAFCDYSDRLLALRDAAVPGADSQAAGQAILDKASQIFEAQHIPHRCRVVGGRPSEEIIAAVDQHHIDLIIMGSRGMGAVARLFLGSVAMAVVDEAKVPVTLVK